ncbi:FAD-dependent oxidoreductase [Aspergillus alliaceus]|uniref:Asperlicin C monooxygenase n=1 Tax=Petromyces alliaceus TaxID=209559 RepID=ASCM_PETAA|nr:FAD/NAD(P)-binding domain-containing protein [Aspergillus alliaceus]P0DOW1.1 RecName: Full=Asperlicin C monooxygenase [Aspergillus alliaceus]KAB8232043.1 FAD/NAD(P)-binding domain-containing protein [Aspergillus alliaceus]
MTMHVEVGPDSTAPPHSSGIKVIIIGLGIGGLAAAIECHRKGHSVIAFDKAQELKPVGDGIALAHNAVRVIEKWGKGTVGQELGRLSSRLNTTVIYDQTGRFIAEDKLDGFKAGEGHLLPRGELSQVMYKHAKSLGIDMRLASEVDEYWEDENSAGVIVDGEKITADCVVACDGVNSKARRHIIGYEPELRSSGSCVFRGWMTTEEPLVGSHWLLSHTDQADQVKVFAGDGVHVLLSTIQHGKMVFWLCTHKDNDCYDRKKEAPPTPEVDGMIHLIRDWPMRGQIESTIRKTLAKNVMHYPLLIREALSNWRSKGGRMVIIGDAAHPFLPVSGQGAAQAIEDAAVLAITLHLAGKEEVPLALHALEKIRLPRTALLQRSSLELERFWLNIDWPEVEKCPELLTIPRPKWIHGHDCQTHAYTEFAKVVSAIQMREEYHPLGGPRDSTNGESLLALLRQDT